MLCIKYVCYLVAMKAKLLLYDELASSLQPPSAPPLKKKNIANEHKTLVFSLLQGTSQRFNQNNFPAP